MRNTGCRLVSMTCVPVLGLHAQQQRVAGDGRVVDQDRGHVAGGLQRRRSGRRSQPASADVEHRATAARCAAAQPLIASAPAGVVAVPTTFAPAAASASAIARPMPRDAPVTSAHCPCSRVTASSLRDDRASAASSVPLSSSARHSSSGRLSMRRLSPVSTLPGPHSTRRVTPRVGQRRAPSSSSAPGSPAAAPAARGSSAGSCVLGAHRPN